MILAIGALVTMSATGEAVAAFLILLLIPVVPLAFALLLVEGEHGSEVPPRR